MLINIIQLLINKNFIKNYDIINGRDNKDRLYI